jgi:hypothetical protein
MLCDDGGGMAIEVRPATDFEDVATMLGPKRPDANVFGGFPRVLMRLESG